MTKKKVNSDSEDSIPTFSEESGSLGTIRINHSVVAGIVRLATQSVKGCLLYTSPSPRDRQKSRMPSSA